MRHCIPSRNRFPVKEIVNGSPTHQFVTTTFTLAFSTTLSLAPSPGLVTLLALVLWLQPSSNASA